MSRLNIQVHKASSTRPTRIFFCFDDGEGYSWEAPTSAILTQNGDAKLVSDLRAAADELEMQITKDQKESTIKARIQAEMEAEGAV